MHSLYYSAIITTGDISAYGHFHIATIFGRIFVLEHVVPDDSQGLDTSHHPMNQNLMKWRVAYEEQRVQQAQVFVHKLRVSTRYRATGKPSPAIL